MTKPDSPPPPPPGALVSPAADRNRQPILDVLRAHLPARGRVLEIASGGGQHAHAFATALPGLVWQASDPSPEARASIEAWRSGRPPNLPPPLALDAADPATWPEEAFDAVVCINMVHISPWAATEGLMAGAAGVLRRRGVPGGLLCLYGPYLEADVATAASNLAFNESLKARNPAWGLRDRDAVIELARAHGLRHVLRVAMPANNLSLLFRLA
jgi:hypothetical protein